MLQTKQAGAPVSKESRPSAPKNVVNLIDALRRSVASEKSASEPTKSKKRVAGRGEMLLPISGSKKGKEAAKETAKPAERRKAG